MKNKQQTKKRSYRKYDAAFKANAVEQIKQGRSVSELSATLGVSEGLLYKWKSDSNSQSESESEELKRLRKELKKTKEENVILKKALSIFAQTG